MEKIKPNEIEKLVKDNGYKHVCLVSATGQTIIPRNPPDKPVKEKIKQILQKWQRLPDGIYILRCQDNYGKVYPDYDYAMQKGKIDIPNPTNNNNPAQPQQIVLQQAPQETARTYEDALKDKQKIAELEAKLSAMETQPEQIEEDESEIPSIASALKELLPMFLPAVDRHQSIKEREIALKEREMSLREKGAPASPASGGRFKKIHPFRPIPKFDTPAFEKYLDYLEGMSEEQFAQECAYISEHNPEEYAAVQSAFSPEDDTQEEKTA